MIEIEIEIDGKIIKFKPHITSLKSGFGHRIACGCRAHLRMGVLVWSGNIAYPMHHCRKHAEQYYGVTFEPNARGKQCHDEI